MEKRFTSTSTLVECRGWSLPLLPHVSIVSFVFHTPYGVLAPTGAPGDRGADRRRFHVCENRGIRPAHRPGGPRTPTREGAHENVAPPPMSYHFLRVCMCRPTSVRFSCVCNCTIRGAWQDRTISPLPASALRCVSPYLSISSVVIRGAACLLQAVRFVVVLLIP